MAVTAFDVTTEDLESSANKIEQKILQFNQAYNSIYTAVQDLRVSFKGETSDALNERIEGYRNDFEAADKALKNYVEFLRKYASDIKNTEIELMTKANSLSVGR